MIDINDITVRIGSKVLLDHASAHIADGWKVGLVGANGCGKSTLFRVLQGGLETESGDVFFPSGYKVVFVEQELQGLEMSILEFILAQDKERAELMSRLENASELELAEIHERLNMIGAASAEARASVILHGLGFAPEDLSRKVGEFSGGWRMRLALAAALFQPSDVLLLDEPTNHLDQDAREIIKKYLASKKGFILVSHDRDLLDACIDHVLVLNRASIEVQSGNFSSWWENKEKADHFARMEHEKRVKEIGKLKAAADCSSRWAEKNENTKIGYDPAKEHDRSISTRSYIGAKTKKMQSRVKAYEERMDREIEKKEGLLKDIETVKDLKIMPLSHYKERLIECRDFSLKYRDGKENVITGLNFELKQGDRVFLKGKNGCGKSSLIKYILTQNLQNSSNGGIEKRKITMSGCENLSGENIMATGTCSIASNLVISYINQDTSHLSGTLKEFAKKQEIDEPMLLSMLRSLDLDREQFVKNMEEFSEGQKKKVLIAASLLTPAHLYLWDEPLNYIDVFSRMQIEKLIAQFQPTMLIVEHDARFARKLATKVVGL